MAGRTLRDAIAVALEVVPSVELAAGGEKSRRALREYLLGWVKEYALARGVILEDGDLEIELREVIGELRRAKPVETTDDVYARLGPIDRKPLGDIDVPCPACNARPGERCASLVSTTYRDPHVQRIQLAQKGGV